jgi:hypothetical protein
MTKRHLLSGTYTLGLVASMSITLAAVGASCTTDPPKTTTTSSSSSSTSGGMGGAGGASSSSGSMGGMGGDGGTVIIEVFPKEPIFEDGLAAEIATVFEGAGPSTPNSVCISEPASDAMIPRNWTPLFIDFAPKIGQNVFEIKVEVDNQPNALVVYTSKYDYRMPQNMWNSLAASSGGHDAKITIRTIKYENGMITDGPYSSETTTVHIAPVDAPGSVVYWAYEPITKATSFRGFTVGDPSTKVVLTPETAGMNAGGKQTGCVSCHASSPDGKIMFYSSDDPPGLYRSVDARLVTGGKPDTMMISNAAFALLGRHRQLSPLLSPAHYSDNDAVLITTYVQDPGIKYELIWTDLHAADASGTGVIARTGDPRNPTSATWSHDGKDIAYVSSAGGHEGVIAETTGQDQTMDIYVVPYNNRMGGNATPLPGASDPQKREFYPIYSPDDTFIAFNRSDTANSSYDQATAEVFVVPRAGGVPTRLKANDPQVCTGLKSPGIANSWSRWAPQAQLNNGLRYYWLVFSSKRRVAAALRPQLYISAIVTKVEAGGVETLVADYPGVYVGTQNIAESNHTPVWDYFVVDQIPK